jgi:hypothetical protein
LTPLAALAADLSPAHLQDEIVNSDAQFDLTVKQISDLQSQANLAAANERMIMLLRSQGARQMQLSLSANGNAMEEIAAALANSARSQGDVNARNSLGIAQIQANVMLTKANDSLANALAQGRMDEITNARAQSNFTRQLADLITGTLAEQNIANDKLIAQGNADKIHTPAIVQQQNQIAMGANQLLAADVFLAAGQVNATSASLSVKDQAAQLLAHAQESKRNARAMAFNL